MDKQELLTASCGRVSRGESVSSACYSTRNTSTSSHVGDYKYWTMKECADFDLDAGDEVPYRDHRQFVIRQGDTGKREEYRIP